MNTGVSTTPCGVVSLPARAAPDVVSISKQNDTSRIVATTAEADGLSDWEEYQEKQIPRR
jgi:hypothetical protein